MLLSPIRCIPKRGLPIGRCNRVLRGRRPPGIAWWPLACQANLQLKFYFWYLPFVVIKWRWARIANSRYASVRQSRASFCYKPLRLLRVLHLEQQGRCLHMLQSSNNFAGRPFQSTSAQSNIAHLEWLYRLASTDFSKIRWESPLLPCRECLHTHPDWRGRWCWWCQCWWVMYW